MAEQTVALAGEDEEALLPGPEDRDPSNLMFRAGCLRGMALQLPPGNDRTMLIKASRSLLAYAEESGFLPKTPT